jgi:phosphoribosylamine-glycine ligase
MAVTVNEARASSYHRAKVLIAEVEPKIDEMLLAGGRTFDCSELGENVRDAVVEVYEINGWLVMLDGTSIGFWEEQ